MVVRAGAIVAVKGVGGFLLAVDGSDEAAVARLRARKQRPHKPLALMARDLDQVARVASLGPVEREALLGPARPIVLVRRRADAAVAAGVAPGLAELGVMLPSTPLQQLLVDDGPPLQVMTSGNASDEPIAKDNDDALARLAGVADGFLLHDRAIHTRDDDSVVRVVAGGTQPVRRARGLVPEPIALGFAAPPVLAVGGQLKAAVCWVRDGQAHLSQHLGDLDSLAARQLFEETIAKLGRLLAVEPALVAHDLHPDYASTRWALAAPHPRCGVQHHHAHVAACLAEHGRRERAIGVAFDGTGCGPDGSLWGGELLLFDLAGFVRLGHLRPLALPGGEAAIRQPWRLALAALLDAGEPPSVIERLLGRVATAQRRAVQELIARRVATPLATGAGRWFDAVAALAGVRDEVSYEGQAAAELESACAASGAAVEPYPFAVDDGAPFQVDLRPTVRAIAAALQAGASAALVAARFHETLARVVRAACLRARAAGAPPLVALSGGCFQNRRLSERAQALLEEAGFEVLVHRRVPPSDGGLALGQAAVASYRLHCKESGHVPRHPG
jgi:hydrogenase maturation protein HypF